MGSTKPANVHNGPTAVPVGNGTTSRSWNTIPGITSGIVCGTDAIDQTIRALQGAQMLNWATLGANLDGNISDLKNPLAKPEVPGEMTEAQKKEKLRNDVLRSKLSTADKKKFMASMPADPVRSARGENIISIGEGLASLLEGLHTISARNRAAQEVIEALQSSANRIRDQIPPDGGVLVRTNIMVNRSEPDDMRLVGVFVEGKGTNAADVAAAADAPRPLEWRAAPAKPLDPEIQRMLSNPKEYEMKSFRIWVVSPCINLNVAIPRRPGSQR